MPLVINKINKKEEISALSENLCINCDIESLKKGGVEEIGPKLCDNACGFLALQCVAASENEERKLHCQATIDYCNHFGIPLTCYKCPNIYINCR